MRNENNNFEKSKYNNGTNNKGPLVCQYCDSIVLSDDDNCNNCGASTASAQLTESIHSKNSSNSAKNTINATALNKKRVISSIVAIAVVLTLILTVNYLFNKPNINTYYMEVGESCDTKWFSFEVSNVEVVNKYNNENLEYSSPNGFYTVIIDMTIKNTFEDYINMLEEDFLLIGDNTDFKEDYLPVIDETLNKYFDTSDKKMFCFFEDEYGNYFSLSSGESITGRLIYVIKDDIKKAKLNYTEYNNEGEKGDTYIVNLF